MAFVRLESQIGISQIVYCFLQAFPHKEELLRNMMGLLGNVAEVKALRRCLMTTQFVTVFADLLDTSSEGIEVLYGEIETGRTLVTCIIEKCGRTVSETHLVNRDVTGLCNRPPSKCHRMFYWVFSCPEHGICDEVLADASIPCDKAAVLWET